jgi:hypothetical protein
MARGYRGSGVASVLAFSGLFGTRSPGLALEKVSIIRSIVAFVTVEVVFDKEDVQRGLCSAGDP